jgi:hypothetical protein
MLGHCYFKWKTHEYQCCTSHQDVQLFSSDKVILQVFANFKSYEKLVKFVNTFKSYERLATFSDELATKTKVVYVDEIRNFGIHHFSIYCEKIVFLFFDSSKKSNFEF